MKRKPTGKFKVAVKTAPKQASSSVTGGKSPANGTSERGKEESEQHQGTAKRAGSMVSIQEEDDPGDAGDPKTKGKKHETGTKGKTQGKAEEKSDSKPARSEEELKKIIAQDREALQKEYRQRAQEEEAKQEQVMNLVKQSPGARQADQVVNVRNFKSAKDYLTAMIQRQVKNNDPESQAAHIFKDVKVDYHSKLLVDFRVDHVKGDTLKAPPVDLSELIKKHEAGAVKEDLKRQVVSLRLNQGILKQEYKEKMASIKDNWKGLQASETVPDKATASELVGVVSKKVEIKNLSTAMSP